MAKSANSNMMKIQGAVEKQRGIYYELDVSEPPLGEGGTGIVRRGYLVDEAKKYRREVAIKFLFNDLSENSILRSKREAAIHIKHENLIEMLDFVQIVDSDLYGHNNIRYHVVSELLHGVMLLDIIDDNISTEVLNNCLPIKELHDLCISDRNRFAVIVISNVLAGIQALHENGYVHRDIDPSNIMVTETGQIKLIDLGIAKELNKTSQTQKQLLTQDGQFVGKAAYAAPELVRGDIVNQNETTDVYAVGILLYQIITGNLPFTGTIDEILKKQINEKIPVENIENRYIRKLVRKATEKKQDLRYQSASEFREELNNWENNEQTDKKLLKKLLNIRFNHRQLLILISVLGGVLGCVFALIFK